MTNDHKRVKDEANASHEETLELLKETTKSVSTALDVLSMARTRLLSATKKYEERLNGPESKYY